MAAGPFGEAICSPIERMGELCHALTHRQALFCRMIRTYAQAEAKRERGTRDGFRESLDRGLRLLQFRRDQRPDDAERSRRAAELPRATARRMLFTLQRGGFVVGDGKLFSLTPHVLTLAASYLRSSQLVAVLQPVLDRVATAAQEISSLAVLDGDGVVFIARSSPARMFSAGLEIGYRLPAFCTSVGRAMLGQFDDAALGARLKTMKREMLTPQTVTTEAAAEASQPIASKAIRWSIARPSRISARSRFRSAATTARSSPPSTWAPMSTACRQRRLVERCCRCLRETGSRSNRCGVTARQSRR